MKTKTKEQSADQPTNQYHHVATERFEDIEQTLAIALNMILSAEERIGLMEDDAWFDLHQGINEVTKALLKAKDATKLAGFWGLNEKA
jgi:hypothetical protein